MTRGQEESFSQDRLGNVNRDIDPVRGQDGMEDERGFTVIEGGDTDEPVIIMEIPDGASGFHLDSIHAYNDDSADGTVQVWSATLTNMGTVDELTEKSIRYVVPQDEDRQISYVGKEFDEEAVVVQSSFEGDIALGGFMDHKEEQEPAAEQREAPGA